MNAALKLWTVERERYSDALVLEIAPLLRAQWEEIAVFKDEIPLDPDFDAYARADREGRLFVFTARRDGALIGYSVFFLVRHPHYKSTLFAVNDVIYVTPEHRKGRVGLALIRQSERLARLIGQAAGVKVKISWHVKLTNDFRELLERLGYLTEEHSMGRVF